jgi:threonine dehydratase
MRGLVRTGRLLRLGVQISDLPGNLARVTELIARLGGNIVEVEHERWYRDVPVRMAQIEILVEVRNSGDGHSLAEGLADAGFPARVLGTEYTPG